MIRAPFSLSTRVIVWAALALLQAWAPYSAQAQTTALFLDSQPGDYIGEGLEYNYTPAQATFQISRNSRNGVTVYVQGPTISNYWYLNFSAAGDAPLAVGSYEAARRLPFAPGNGLDVFGMHRGCGDLTGRFVVREIVLAPDGTVLKFAADFEQLCQGVDGALFGAVRYDSTVSTLLPFDGAYPIYQLTITPDAHGRVTSAGIDCGSSASACVVTLPSPSQLTLTAVPDAGYEFVSWGGDCSGGVTTWIRVNQIKSCSAVFEPGFHGTTALVFDSQPGDYIGQGTDTTYSPLDGTFVVTRNDHNGVSVSFRTPAMLSYLYLWQLEFSATGDAPLTAGTYGAATAYPWTPLNGLLVHGSGRSCSSLTGRFIVHEVVYRSDGSVRRFAADFEQHCGDGVPALFGAIRYNSTISGLTPFGGHYPSYRLDVSTVGGGRVTGGGIDCRAGGPVCQLTLAAAAQVALTATPDSGNVFAGWTSDCRGTAATSLHVNGPKTCAAVFEPLISASPRTFLYWDSQPGDYIGRGLKGVYNLLNSRWTASSGSGGNRVSLSVVDGYDDWHLDFSAPEGQPLSVGYYSAARRAAFTTFNGLEITGSGAGCNDLTGRFVILDIAVATDGTVQRFAADFEQHCSDSVPALVGAVRYNSAAGELLPFGGQYPSYQLSMTPPAGGRVSGPDLACGGGSTQCLLTLPAAAQVTLTATPDAGYMFMGWTEDCSGGATTTLHVNGAKRCAARFEPADPITPRTLLRWSSQPGHYIGQGRSETYSPVNSKWTALAYQDGAAIEFRVTSVDPRSYSYWTMTIQAPLGELLQAGRRYAGAAGHASAGIPGIDISGNGRACGGGGEFTVHEASFGPQGAVLRFAATFVLDCGAPAGPLLTGSVQYNSDLALQPTTLTVDPRSLRFTAVHNGGSITLAPSPQVLHLSMSNPNAGWRATASAPWIHLSPSSGTGPTALTVALDLSGMPPGSGGAAGTVSVVLTDGSAASWSVAVTLSLLPTATTAPPFGYVDSPIQGAGGINGAIPISGWALDDFEVAGVTICRAPVAGEIIAANPNCGGAAQVFVGHAVFIEGARPDVQAAYATYPKNNIGGWGFMLLTNMLPNQGNGRFEFSVYARDREGRTALIGTRAITCDNAFATRPFGTIDTPGQGDAVAGSSYVNFGWALTPAPKQIPIDGSTLMVYVDGVPVGSPSYNHYRSDIATLFPGLANSAGPVGFKLIDTTTLQEGLHTIVWTATDSAGMTSGLGSRYFRVFNGSSAGTTAAVSAASNARSPHADIEGVPLEASPVLGRRSWEPDAPWQHYAAGPSGRVVLRGEEIDRFELGLGGQQGESIVGYLRVGEDLGPLPIGSKLDSRTGSFTWSPGVGFIGTYDLVFVRQSGGRAIARREVRVVLAPKGSGHVGTQVVIDTPRSQQDVAQPFVLGGWAADLDAAAGTGIDAIHVWAYPLTGGAPVFLGAATYGGARPDVAAVHGDQFSDTGFGLAVQGLVPGNYDLAVFAWSAVSGGFMPARTVRITAR